MCQPLTFYSWPLWWPLYLAGLATTTACKLSEAAPLWRCNPPSSPLIKLHIKTLRLNPRAGLKQPYEMQGRPLHLVPPNCGGN